jgi:hypothetical protein
MLECAHKVTNSPAGIFKTFLHKQTKNCHSLHHHMTQVYLQIQKTQYLV